MLFSSYEFIFLFLPIVIYLFFKIGQKSHQSALAWLVFSSFIFYGWWDYRFIPIIVISIIYNFVSGYLLNKGIKAKSITKKIGLISGLVFNLGLLGYFKYVDFFIINLNSATDSNISLLHIALPLAISFFTFQQIAFLVDCYRGLTHQYNFLHYCLFVCFFPQLIAGPIVHHEKILPQFSLDKTFAPNIQNIQTGITIFIIGLFKKVIIADSIARYATPVFSDALVSKITFFEAWGAALAYTFQLYFDFSGYADMAIGAALIINIQLPLNFNSPYKARNITEFWRRWHITLSNFLRDYLYIPLGGNRNGPARRHSNLLITMLLGGIWHGAGWTFLVWGALHGCYLIINQVWSSFCQKFNIFHKMQKSKIWKYFAWGLTFLSVVVGWVVFRAETFTAASNIFTGMLGVNGIIFPSSIASEMPFLNVFFETMNFKFVDGIGLTFIMNYLWILFAAIVAFCFPNPQSFVSRKSEETNLNRSLIDINWVANIKWASIMAIMMAISILGLNRVGEFIYFQF